LIHILALDSSNHMTRPWLPNCSVQSCGRCALSANSRCNRSFCSPPLLLPCTRQYAACPRAASSTLRRPLERRRRRSRIAHALHSLTLFCGHLHAYPNHGQLFGIKHPCPSLCRSRT
jgi:hypothetical protein